MSSITITKKPGQKILELGGGDNPNPATDVNCDIRPGPKVHIPMDFSAFPWPLQDAEWDAVFSAFCLEHISFTKTAQFLAECKRILKPNGRLVLVTPNTEAQIQWLLAHPEGWDGKDLFTSASELLYGSQDYEANAHKTFFSPAVMTKLLTAAGFHQIVVQPYGDRDTDLGVQATRPETDVVGAPASVVPADVVFCDRCKAAVQPVPNAANYLHCTMCGHTWTPSAITFASTPMPPPAPVSWPTTEIKTAEPLPAAATIQQSVLEDRAPLFDKEYFHGGRKVGGYAHEGYRDFPVHEVTFQHVMARKPESVLELGCARGYLVKRFQDAGIPAAGIEISRHCYLTRACGGIYNAPANAANLPDGQHFDLALSVAFFEHVPEAQLPAVLNLLKERTKRGLHGIDFGHKDDGFDKTHCTLRPKEWWVKLFNQHGLTSHEIVNKEELETGEVDQAVRTDPNGLKKLNIGSHMVMAHRGWLNIDVLDLSQFAGMNGYDFRQLDVTQGLPVASDSVDLIAMSHVLEHFEYPVGIAVLRECRRVLKRTGGLRIAVPDAEKLMGEYLHDVQLLAVAPLAASSPNLKLDQYAELNDGVAHARTPAVKLWALLHAGHSAAYDALTLRGVLDAAGFVSHPASFRMPGCPATMQIVKELIDQYPDLTCYMDATPKT